jgi:hypothetical protein
MSACLPCVPLYYGHDSFAGRELASFSIDHHRTAAREGAAVPPAARYVGNYMLLPLLLLLSSVFGFI